jgi:uncharacterized integral membrane protein (TIGR00697 family)
MSNQDKENFWYIPLIGMLLVTVSLTANIFAARLLMTHFVFFDLLLPGGIIAFPATFAILDVVTEHYGYKRASSLIKFNLICQCVFSLLVTLILKLHPHISQQYEIAFHTVLGTSISIFFASLFASLIAETVNCKILATWRAYVDGRHLWLRAVGSTAVGELVFSCIWVLIFFYSNLSAQKMVWLIFSQYLVKVLYEVVCVPFTYIAVYLLKKHENVKRVRYVNFNPSLGGVLNSDALSYESHE